MGQPMVVSELARHNGNGHHDIANDSSTLYEAGFKAGYREGFEAGLGQARLQAAGSAPKPVTAPPAAKHLLLGPPCPTCGAYFYADEACPRCNPTKDASDGQRSARSGR